MFCICLLTDKLNNTTEFTSKIWLAVIQKMVLNFFVVYHLLAMCIPAHELLRAQEIVKNSILLQRREALLTFTYETVAPVVRIPIPFKTAAATD